MTRVFFDLEFTSLHQKAQPISIGCVTDSGPQTFYAEFSDYDPVLLSPWVIDNVLPKLHLKRLGSNDGGIEHATAYKGVSRSIATMLASWLRKLAHEYGGPIEMWGDVLPYDWVIFCELYGGSQNLPKYIYYIPFDIATLMKVKGVDPDISRQEFIGQTHIAHDALQDAALCGLCYDKLMGETWRSAT